MTLGESLISVFVPIYFYNLGFEIYQILFFYLLISLSFVLFFYLGAKIVAKIGKKHAILISTPFLIIYYIGLIFVDSQPWLFFILPTIVSIRMILFNYGYHLNYITHSEKKERGGELALFGIITLLASVFSPYLGSLLASFNFSILFIISSILMVLGTIPLFFSPDGFEKLKFTANSLLKKIISKNNRGNFISFSGYAIESIIGRTIWPIFIIIIVGSLNKTGLIISTSMLLSLIAFSFIGKLTDKVNRIKLLKVGATLYFFAWVGRIFANTSYKVLFIDSYKNLSEKVLHLPWSAHSYDLAQRSDYFEFIVSREIIFNLIRIIVLPFLIFIFYINFHPFLISFLVASLSSIGYIFIDKEI